MSRSELIEKPTRMNEVLRVMEPMPEGPYYIANQHQERNFDGITLEIAEAIVHLNSLLQDKDELRNKTPRLFFSLKIPNYTWGSVVFYNENGKLKRCLEHFDTSG